VLLAAVSLPLARGADAPANQPPASLDATLAQLKVPPDWFTRTPIAWDTNKPWKEARLEIRRLLALDEDHNRQAVKLTWLYAQKGDIGDGHELPMYLFMSGNYAWAALEYPKYLKATEGQGATHAYLCYASCLEHFGENDAALAVLNKALSDLPPKPWRIANTANIHNHLGDYYARLGHTAKATEHYQQAIRLYPTSDQPYGRHLLPRHAAKVQSKLDLLTLQALENARLRDGTFTGRSLGYAENKELVVTVTIRGGKIADLKVQHEEKIDLGATHLIPQRILARQSLRVDGITGATVTSQGIVDGAFQALKQAGLK
jgi:uncharacterized protein with FMN-binding domain